MKEKKKAYFTPLVKQIIVFDDNVLLASQSDNLFSDEEIFDGGGV